MATGGNEDMSDEIFNFKCSNCVKVNRHRDAVKYCIQCQGYCCQSCVDSHQIIPALIGHQLLDKSNFKSSVLTTDLPVVPTEICPLHGTKIVDFYCGNHDTVGCSSCMVLEHRNCSDVLSIPEVIDDLFNVSDIDKTHQNLREKKKTLEKVTTLRQSLIQELSKSKAESINAIREFRKEMESLLDKLENASMKEVEDEYRKLETSLKTEKKRAEEETDGIKQAADDLRKAEGNKAQEFVSMKRAQKKIQYAEEISASMDSPANSKITFVPNRNVQDILKDLKMFGRVESQPLSCPKRTTIYSIKSSGEINIRLKSDSTACNVYGSCTTGDGMLLLADRNNIKLKRVDPATLSVLDHCELPNSPWSICCISKQEAAVTLNNNTVQFVSLDKQLTPSRQLKLGHYCYGIAYRNDRLYISDSGKSVYIHDMTGKLMQTVSKDGSGDDLFKFNRLLAVSDSGDIIFVGDWYLGIVRFDAHGRYIHTFSDKELSNPSGICTDRRGNVFVCGCNSHNVIQIAHDGKKKIGVVVKKSVGLNRPFSVCFESQNLTLFVTQELNDIVKVYQLQ